MLKKHNNHSKRYFNIIMNAKFPTGHSFLYSYYPNYQLH